MSRTYRHTNGNKKVLKGTVISNFDDSYDRSVRGVKKMKNGVSTEDHEYFIATVHGHFGYSVPKSFRKHLKKKRRNKQKQELIKAFIKDDYDNVGNIRDVKNARWEYF